VAETSCFFLKTKTRRRMMKRTMTKKMKKICLVELGQKIGIASLDSLRETLWWEVEVWCLCSCVEPCLRGFE